MLQRFKGGRAAAYRDLRDRPGCDDWMKGYTACPLAAYLHQPRLRALLHERPLGENVR